MNKQRTERIAVHFTKRERSQLKRLSVRYGYASIARFMRETCLGLEDSRGPRTVTDGSEESLCALDIVDTRA